MLDLQRFDSRKLNIGCGFDVRPGYINIDLQEFHKPDIVASVMDLGIIPANFADELVASDLLEHIGRQKTLGVLSEWNRVIKVGGKLWLRTTYLPGLLQRMRHEWFGDLASHKALINDCFSTQAYEGDFHFTAFTEKLMRFFIWAAGFEMTNLGVQDEWLFVVEAVKVKDLSFEDHIENIKPDGDFLEVLYRDILFREADGDGIASKIKLLSSGISRLEIVRGFLGSSEREDMMIATAPPFPLIYDRA